MSVLKWWMVVGAIGEVVAAPVVLVLRQEHAQSLHQQMEEPGVMEPHVKLVTLNLVQLLLMVDGLIGPIGMLVPEHADRVLGKELEAAPTQIHGMEELTVKEIK